MIYTANLNQQSTIQQPFAATMGNTHPSNVTATMVKDHVENIGTYYHESAAKLMFYGIDGMFLFYYFKDVQTKDRLLDDILCKGATRQARIMMEWHKYGTLWYLQYGDPTTGMRPWFENVPQAIITNIDNAPQLVQPPRMPSDSDTTTTATAARGKKKRRINLVDEIIYVGTTGRAKKTAYKVGFGKKK